VTARGPSLTFRRGEVEFDRALSFFDATFAVAMTLLATTLDPGPEGWASWTSLRQAVDGPLLAFLVSFTVIGAYWWGNHRFVSRLDAMSPLLVVGSIAMLGFVVLLPITTRGLGEASGDGHVAPVVYALNVALVSLVELALYLVAVRHRLFREQPAPRAVRATVVDQLGVPVVFLASIPVAVLVSGAVAQRTWLALVVVMPVLGRLARRR
jgi:uncharacterized membrane protein